MCFVHSLNYKQKTSLVINNITLTITFQHIYTCHLLIFPLLLLFKIYTFHLFNTFEFIFVVLNKHQSIFVLIQYVEIQLYLISFQNHVFH